MLNIKEIPLLFSTPMVQALIEDRKTQTRRTRDLEGINENPDEWNLCWVADTKLYECKDEIFGAGFQNTKDLKKVTFIKSPYGKPGDLIWVRETHSIFRQIGGSIQREKTKYKADPQWDKNSLIKWKPSIHMPKDACRIWLMVEEIRVERLQDICGLDAYNEGVDIKSMWPLCVGDAYIAFRKLWQSINGTDSWEQNPWVWVVKFCMLSNSGRPSEELIQAGYNHLTKKEARHV